MLPFRPDPLVPVERNALLEWSATLSAAEIAAARDDRARLLRGLLYGGAGSALLWSGIALLVSVLV